MSKCARDQAIAVEAIGGERVTDVAARHGVSVSRVVQIRSNALRTQASLARQAAEPDWREWHPRDVVQLSTRARGVLAGMLSYTALGEVAADITSGKLDLARNRYDGRPIPNSGRVTAKEMQTFLETLMAAK